ncbi:BREX-3 system phosphatase PglZ [Candidatus Chloroploca sp. M-50]|uniref:BREX-3 system phosphatase PglZ n=1 Tax=Candidatus Chloroploca mongolica TaxID=2528176 RepID=A0ABS4DHJ4_9CHLR|nr:BREX-3 system phosphatase PglZ [Candidatus Chloroploca mongolica]MBP1468895.1 BREX-3 system phosphatase PglZ [Candidatus Chloroploca mongolica]
MMLDQVLAYFPPHTYPLSLVSDPDDLLGDEQLLAVLAERGFRLIAEHDPIVVRYSIQQLLPISAEMPVIIVTAGPLDALPYDLWQQGYHVVLALHQFFPDIAYPALRELSPGQRHRLSAVQAKLGKPLQALAYRDSLDYLLQMVFALEPSRLRSSADWLAWLDGYHARNDPMSPVLAHHLGSRLRQFALLASLPIDAMLQDATAYHRFVQEEWLKYLHKQVRERSEVAYTPEPMLPFEADPALHDLLPRLVRTGTLTPVALVNAATLPSWTRPAVVPHSADLRRQQFAEGVAWLEQQIAPNASAATSSLRWEQWQLVARRWAQLSNWRAAPDGGLDQDHLNRYHLLQAHLDEQFAHWLRANYATLATRALPVPHHLHHIPGWLAYQRQQQPDQRVALLVLDGMSLADWLHIRDLWQTHHPDWRIADRLVLAQIPSMTAISRQALISGKRPAQFEPTLLHNRHEERHWSSFWQLHGLAPDAIALAHLSTTRDAEYPDVINHRRIQALCLVSSVVDAKVHNESQGASGWQATLGVWLHVNDGQHQPVAWLEGLIKHLFNLRYTVVVTSDHGHVEARGMGVPQEGVLVESRSKRARVYSNPDIVRVVQMQFADTIVWTDDGLLPAQTQVMMPQGRRAFAPAGELVISHGGLTIEEMAVPLITITQS